MPTNPSVDQTNLESTVETSSTVGKTESAEASQTVSVVEKAASEASETPQTAPAETVAEAAPVAKPKTSRRRAAPAKRSSASVAKPAAKSDAPAQTAAAKPEQVVRVSETTPESVAETPVYSVQLSISQEEILASLKSIYDLNLTTASKFAELLKEESSVATEMQRDFANQLLKATEPNAVVAATQSYLSAAQSAMQDAFNARKALTEAYFSKLN